MSREARGVSISREGNIRMTVGELIVRLQQYDPTIPVALADWNEEYQSPSMNAADTMCAIETRTLEHCDTMTMTLVLGMADSH